MKDLTLRDLLEAGCHFGHQANRWQPKAKPFIFGERGGVHIIDLAQTREGLIKAGEYLRDLAQSGGSVIFVGTKRQASKIVEEAAEKVRGGGVTDNEIEGKKTENGSGDSGKTNNFYYLLERWPGGLLTNFEVIKKNNLDAIVKLRDDIANNRFVTKKEKLLAQRQLDKYFQVYGGLVGLAARPEAMFLVDIKKEAGAVREARRTGVKIIAITDTNTDPAAVDYPIPANDDAVGSIKIITEYLADSWSEGLEMGPHPSAVCYGA